MNKIKKKHTIGKFTKNNKINKNTKPIKINNNKEELEYPHIIDYNEKKDINLPFSQYIIYIKVNHMIF